MLCAQSETARAQFRHLNGVSALHDVLRDTVRQSEQSAQLVDYIVPHSLNCVWSAVVGDPVSEEMFMDLGGIDTIIDLLETGPQCLKHQLLGCLADMLHSTLAMKYLTAWMSEKVSDFPFPLLLANLWVEEQQKLGVAQGQLGQLDGTFRPLQTGPLRPNSARKGSEAFSRLKHALRMSRLQPQHGSPADVLRKWSDEIDCRAQLFAIAHCFPQDIAFEKLDEIPNKEKSSQARIVLESIWRYPEFALVEAWRDVVHGLEARKVKPIRPDQLIIDRALERGTKTAEEVVDLQKTVVVVHEESKEMDDEEFYNTIRARAAEEKQLEEMKKSKRAPTAMKDFLRAKAHKQAMLKKSARTIPSPSNNEQSVGIVFEEEESNCDE
eukprot:TRINITY_DN6803_c0_g1_i1.p1 TRINITY_DN6803_c0_g1~~TRINITY_DN6803_c0_g1_i1.p1  ORF type:complete len:403 (-),score=161.70 TRINITY_DN6803_c0_g1_i1:27-1169(-)